MSIGNIKNTNDLQNKKQEFAEYLQLMIDNEAIKEKRIKDYKNPNKPPPVPPQYKTAHEQAEDLQLQERLAIDNLKELGINIEEVRSFVLQLEQKQDGIDNLVKLNRNFPAFKKLISEKYLAKTLTANLLLNAWEEFSANINAITGLKSISTSATNIYSNASDNYKKLPIQDDIADFKDFINKELFLNDIISFPDTLQASVRSNLDEASKFLLTKETVNKIDDSLTPIEIKDINNLAENLLTVFKIPTRTDLLTKSANIIMSFRKLNGANSVTINDDITKDLVILNRFLASFFNETAKKKLTAYNEFINKKITGFDNIIEKQKEAPESVNIDETSELPLTDKASLINFIIKNKLYEGLDVNDNRILYYDENLGVNDARRVLNLLNPKNLGLLIEVAETARKKDKYQKIGFEQLETKFKNKADAVEFIIKNRSVFFSNNTTDTDDELRIFLNSNDKQTRKKLFAFSDLVGLIKEKFENIRTTKFGDKNFNVNLGLDEGEEDIEVTFGEQQLKPYQVLDPRGYLKPRDTPLNPKVLEELDKSAKIEEITDILTERFLKLSTDYSYYSKLLNTIKNDYIMKIKNTRQRESNLRFIQKINDEYKENGDLRAYVGKIMFFNEGGEDEITKFLFDNLKKIEETNQPEGPILPKMSKKSRILKLNSMSSENRNSIYESYGGENPERKSIEEVVDFIITQQDIENQLGDVSFNQQALEFPKPPKKESKIKIVDDLYNTGSVEETITYLLDQMEKMTFEDYYNRFKLLYEKAVFNGSQKISFEGTTKTVSLEKKIGKDYYFISYDEFKDMFEKTPEDLINLLFLIEFNVKSPDELTDRIANMISGPKRYNPEREPLIPTQGFGMKKPKKKKGGDLIHIDIGSHIGKHYKEASGKGVDRQMKLFDKAKKEYQSGGDQPYIKSRIKVGAGVQLEESKPKYERFGKFIIHTPQLHKNILNFKYPSEGRVPNLPRMNIDDDTKDLIFNILETGKLSENQFNKLPQSSQDHLIKAIKGAGLEDILFKGKSKVYTKDEKEDRERFNILKGEFDAGNDNPKLIKELRGLVIKFSNSGIIPKKQGLEFLTILNDI